VRKLLLMLLVALSLGLVAGCGGDDNDDDGADAGADVDTLLEQTFSSSKDIDSGKLDVSLRASGAGLDNAIQADLSGPFQSEGDKQLPLVALSASLEGSGQSFEAGVTNTGEKGFVNFQGTDYEVSGPVYQQFKAAYEQTAADQQGQSLASLGIDPRKWLANAKNAGSADVGGTETMKITGDVDVAKLLDDVNAALQKLRSLGLQGSDQLPEQLTPAQKQQAVDAIKDINVEIYTGADDTILRRLLVTMTLQAPEQDAVDVELDISLLEVNEDQEIPEPSDAKPFSELAEQLGGLGLGGLGGSGGSGSDSGGGASQENLEKYSKCIQDAGADTEKARKCADLIAP
jgi:hypothetical protein